MKKLFVCLLAIGVTGCTYNPLADKTLRAGFGEPLPAGPEVKITFFGNSTLLISDGQKSLLVDGFFSRPGPLDTLFSRIEPDPAELDKALRHIPRVDAILVGHAHHDHSLDATEVAGRMDTTVIGSRAFENLYNGSGGPENGSRIEVVPPSGRTFDEFKPFTVHFIPSRHVHPHWFPQRLIKPDITAPLKMPAHYTQFGCGDVFALYIEHDEGDIAITTTAAAVENQFRGRPADVVFLGIGLLSKESDDDQALYWRETVERPDPDLTVLIHWDSFTRPLDKGLRPGLGESSRKLMKIVKAKAGPRKLRVLNLGESVQISGGSVYCPAPSPGSPGT